jgi:uncharacterized phage protein gp47/JayE
VANEFVRRRTEEILDGMITNARARFGDNLNTRPDGILYQFFAIHAEQIAVAEEAGEIGYLAFDANAVTGSLMDRLYALNGLTRQAATPSTVTCTFTGSDGTTIPLGFIVVTSDTNQRFQTTETGDISGGSVDLAMESVEAGPIVALAGTLTVIESALSGLSSVTNALDALPGDEQETDTEFRQRRQLTLATAGNGTVESIAAAIINEVEDVEQATVYENKEATTSPEGISPYAIKAIVLGGVDADIAGKIFETVPAGTPTDGATTVPVTDSQGIDHDISFSRPTAIDIYVTVNITTDADYPADGANLIKAALVAYGDALRIGDDVIYSRLYTPINSIPGHQVDSLFVDTVSPPTGTANLSIDFDELAVFDSTRIVVNAS